MLDETQYTTVKDTLKSLIHLFTRYTRIELLSAISHPDTKRDNKLA